MFRELKAISNYVAGTELAISVHKEPLLRDLVYNGLNGSTTFWPRANPNSEEGMDRRGDIYVTFNSDRNGVHRALVMDFVVTAPKLVGDMVGDATKRATDAKYYKYRKVWKIPEGDKVFCPYALEPTGFVHGDAELQLQGFLGKVFNMPPRGSDIPPPYEYQYFYTRIRTSLSLALAKGVAEKVYRQRARFTRVAPVVA